MDLEKLSAKQKIDTTINGYNQIAHYWNQTRLIFWPELEDLIINTINKYNNNIKILDIGCGNGRLLNILNNQKINNELNYTGFDPSEKLIQIARETWPQNIFHIGQLKENHDTTFKDNEFDLAISIAVIHHIPSEIAKDWLNEISRIVKKNGYILITSWDLTTSRYNLDKNNDAMIDFMHYKNVRFQHNYTKQEIENIIKETSLSLEYYNEISRESGNTNLVFLFKNKNYSNL